MINDDELVVLIRRVLADSPFAGEGYRKVRARLRREHDARVSGKRVLEGDIARGLELRHDWGPQYRSAHFTGSLAWLGIADSPAFLVYQTPTVVPVAGSTSSSGK